MRVWRLCREEHAKEALTGEGARRFAARWNPAGVPLVYTSMYKSLACLEIFVNLRAALLQNNYVAIAVDTPDDLPIPAVPEASLPRDWKLTGNLAARAIGEDWVRSGRSVALSVPSAVIDDEWNVLLNPAHPDFDRLEVKPPKPFYFDARMFR